MNVSHLPSKLQTKQKAGMKVLCFDRFHCWFDQSATSLAISQTEAPIREGKLVGVNSLDPLVTR